MEFISGELIAYDLASKLCELNDWALDSDNHAIAEIQYRESIERGLSEGQITPYSPVTFGKLSLDKRVFESAVFSVQEVMNYLEGETDGDFTKEQYTAGYNYGLAIGFIKKELGTVVFCVDWQYWLKKSAWTPEQAVCLLYGINPLEYPKIADNQQIEKLRLDAEDKGKMTPYQWQQFGVEQKFPIPKKISLIEKPMSEPQAEVVPDAGAGSQDDVEPESTKVVQASIKPKEPTLSKLEKQQAAILATIKAKGFEPMKIPDGEKGTIKSICELENKDDLFKAGTAFDAAWKNGIRKLWQMEHHDSYAHRGNK